MIILNGNSVSAPMLVSDKQNVDNFLILAFPIFSITHTVLITSHGNLPLWEVLDLRRHFNSSFQYAAGLVRTRLCREHSCVAGLKATCSLLVTSFRDSHSSTFVNSSTKAVVFQHDYFKSMMSQYSGITVHARNTFYLNPRSDSILRINGFNWFYSLPLEKF